MKKLIPPLAAVLVIAAGAAVYVYSERLMQPRSGETPQAPTSVAGTSEGTRADGNAPAPKPGETAMFWRDPTGGDNEVWRLRGSSAPERHPVQKLDAGWKALVFAPGGWGGDDLLVWRNDTSGQLRIWRLARDGGMAAFEILPYSGAEWRIVAASDMDGDGDADLGWIGPNGSVAVWTLQDGKPGRKETVGTARAGWQLIQVANFDEDGSAEMLWRDPASGQMVLWDMNGADKAVERNLPGVPVEWTLIGAGQLDGADAEDLLWRNDSGTLAIWRGLAAANALLIGRTEVPDWAYVGLADVDTDGRADVLWRHRNDGSMGAWSIAEDGRVSDIGLPLPPRSAELVPTGYVAP